MYPRIAYVTARGVEDPDVVPALAAFDRARLAGEAVAWDDDVTWGDFDLVLVRSAWDYPGRRPEFLRWARGVEDRTVLANSARILAKNTDRTYLRDMTRAGVVTVATAWLEPGDDPGVLAQNLAETDWARFTVRPSIGLFEQALVDTPAEAASCAADIAAQGRVAMVQSAAQPPAVVSVILLAGTVSHAVRREASGAGRAVPVPDEVALLLPRIQDVGSDGEDLLYARVDLVGQDAEWELAAFEATGPGLYLASAAGAADRLAQAVRGVLSPAATA